MNTIKIRKAKIADASFLVELAEQMDYKITSNEAKSRLVSILNQKEDIFLVACDEKQVVGFVHGITIFEVLTPKSLRLGGLVVSANYRKSGIGRKLMETLEEWARNKKFSLILVPSNIKRKGAHLFYEKIGYRKLKIQAVFCKEF